MLNRTVPTILILGVVLCFFIWGCNADTVSDPIPYGSLNALGRTATVQDPAAANDTGRYPVTITFNLTINSPTTAVGTFSTSGAFADHGAASETFFIAPPPDSGKTPRTAHGIKTLTGKHGTIKLRFQGRIIFTGKTTSNVVGRFVFVGGTGAYARLHGTGTTNVALNFVTGGITGSYTGHAVFDQGSGHAKGRTGS